MEKREKIYEGKAKILFATEDSDLIIQYFKDEATAFDGKKRGIIENKGIYNNKISAYIFKYLEEKGIETHFVKLLSDREMLIRKVQIIPVEVVMRNIIAGSLAKRFGMEEGGNLSEPILEFYYKNDKLGDPMINEYHIKALNLATLSEIEEIKNKAFRVNELLVDFFRNRGIVLVDFKLEFGRDSSGKIILADEISPDGCRLWEEGTREKLDKDRFRRDLGRIEESYMKVYERVTGTIENR